MTLIVLFLWNNKNESQSLSQWFEMASSDESVSLGPKQSSIAISVMLYKRVYDEYPQGDTASIAKALSGDNPLNIVFSNYLCAGEFIDPWGVAYDISIKEGEHIFVRSAGKNQIMGDDDDVLYQTDGRRPEEWWNIIEESIKGSDLEQDWKKAMEWRAVETQVN